MRWRASTATAPALRDVEAQLRELRGARRSMRRRAPGWRGAWSFWPGWLLLLMFAGAWGARWWQDQQLWEGYLERLRAQPGIVITEVGQA